MEVTPFCKGRTAFIECTLKEPWWRDTVALRDFELGILWHDGGVTKVPLDAPEVHRLARIAHRIDPGMQVGTAVVLILAIGVTHRVLLIGRQRPGDPARGARQTLRPGDRSPGANLTSDQAATVIQDPQLPDVLPIALMPQPRE